MFYQVMVKNQRIPGNFTKNEAFMIAEKITLDTWENVRIYQHGKLYETIKVIDVLEKQTIGGLL
jgi:hypothetical protein